MLSRTTKIYKAKDNKGDFFFPEQKYAGIDPNLTALALSGGGSRAFIAALGMIKFLSKNKLIDKLSYISTVSGSNWFIGPYIYRDVNMGIYRKPENITMKILENDNIEEDFIGNTIINFSIISLLKEAKNLDLPKEKYWTYIIGKTFLSQYNLFDKSCVENEERVEFYKNNNFIDCETPLEGRPFWLSNATIRADLGPISLTSCSMYSGVSSRIKVNNTFIGGYLIECPCLDAKNPNIHLEEQVEETDIEIYSPFTLNDIIGTSSAAFAGLIEKYQSSLSKIVHKIGISLKNLIPSYNLFDIKKDIDLITDVVDGYMVDNNGIIPLLARGCKKILVMSASDEINHDDYYNANFLYLFGKWSESGGNTIDECISDTCQVFKSEDIDIFIDQIKERKESGGPIYVRATLEVLPNKRHAIKGGYEVEILMFFIYPCHNFMKRLIPEVKNEINKKGKLANFPNFKTVMQNKNEIAAYTREQVNILSYYIQWILKESIDEIIDFI